MVVLIDTVSPPPVRPRHPEKVNRPDALSPPKPDWIRVRAPNTRGYADTRKIVKENGLVTVCEEAGCPNIGECWDKKHAVMRYVPPDEFSGYEKVAYTKGFLMVSASPLTRSSHHAGDDFARLKAARAALAR